MYRVIATWWVLAISPIQATADFFTIMLRLPNIVLVVEIDGYGEGRAFYS